MILLNAKFEKPDDYEIKLARVRERVKELEVVIEQLKKVNLDNIQLNEDK